MSTWRFTEPQWSPVFATGVTLLLGPLAGDELAAAMEPGLRDRGHASQDNRLARLERPQWSPVFATGVTSSPRQISG